MTAIKEEAEQIAKLEDADRSNNTRAVDYSNVSRETIDGLSSRIYNAHKETAGNGSPVPRAVTSIAEKRAPHDLPCQY